MDKNVSPALEQLEEKAKEALIGNRKQVRKGGREYDFTCPCRHLYHWQWLWDSCFHAIATRWFDPDYAKREILSLLYGQWKDGRIPNMVHIGYNWRFDRLVHGTLRDTSGITQPPIIADAVMRIHESAPDRAFLEKVFEPLARYYKWLQTARDTDGDGLIAIFHPWESGIDNSPRWDGIFNIREFNRKKFDLVKGKVMFKFNFARYNNEKMRRVSPYFVKGIDMNCYYYWNLKAMASMAGILNKEAEAREFEAMARKTRQAIQGRLWNPETKKFGDLVGESQEFSYVPTPFSCLPLWAGIADPEQARLIHEEIRDPNRFWTNYPIPTTAADYPAFDPEGYWRGTVWINVNWFMVEGLARNGFVDTAMELREKTLSLVDRGGIREYYNPFTGEGLGARNFGWSTLVIDLINRDFGN